MSQQLERIAAVNQHLRRALDQVADAVMILEGEPLIDAGPRIIYANESAIRLLGREVGRLIGAHVGCFLEQSAVAGFLAGLQSETLDGNWEVNLPLLLVGGRTVPSHWTVSAARDQEGAVLNYTATFYLESANAVHAETSEPIQISVAQPFVDPDPRHVPAPDQYQADQVSNIRETSRRVAHEFNNALTAIMMPVGVAARLAPPGSDLLEKLILAQRSAEKAAGLAKDFLECFRPREAVKERTCLEDLLSRTLRLATVAEQVECQLSFSDDLLAVQVDPEQIERVFFNLIRNACDAMQQKGRLLIKAVNVTVGTTEDPSGNRLAPGPYVRVIVRDYGPGIQPEHMQHLFHQRFTTKPHGNGCGLPICYQIVQEHGGSMYVSSKVNVGTAFDIFLPAAVIPEAVAQSPTVPFAAPDEGSALPTAEVAAPPLVIHAPSSLLIVEDDDIIRMVTSDITKQLGWEVESAAAGDEALNILRTRHREDRPIKAVLLDMNLAGAYSGLQTFERMQQMDADLRVIATSGDHQDPDAYRRMGFVTFLPKPYSWESLQKTLNDVLSS
jgi:two-component system cell cycle sensor histidine kinase/response regulator CckA